MRWGNEPRGAVLVHGREEEMMSGESGLVWFTHTWNWKFAFAANCSAEPQTTAPGAV